MSRPSRANGIACDCTAVGDAHFRSRIALNRRGSSCSSANEAAMGTSGTAVVADLAFFLFFAFLVGVTVVVAAVAVAVSAGVEGSGELRGSDCDSSLDVSSGTSCSLSLRFAIVCGCDVKLRQVLRCCLVEVCVIHRFSTELLNFFDANAAGTWQDPQRRSTC
jgi:hypothetical protein